VSTITLLDKLNEGPREEFIAALADVFEHSPWVAERVCEQRPFRDVNALHAAMMSAVDGAGSNEKLAFLCAHPELAGREAAVGELTQDSTNEQARLGFTALSRADLERVSDINRRYREKHGFPAIVALALHANRETVIAEMQHRIANDTETEITNALEQIHHITLARIAHKFAHT
jgi:OHCU decarboxylase